MPGRVVGLSEPSVDDAGADRRRQPVPSLDDGGQVIIGGKHARRIFGSTWATFCVGRFLM
jgi:hypothetical protein